MEALGSEYYKLDVHDMKKELSVISTPDLGSVGRAFGGKGALVHDIDRRWGRSTQRGDPALSPHPLR
ncbi:MAG: hypothetical protein A2W68_14950 [Betaproteobacteria bacterium RIFCSPLOWO2_02_64_14]|nr:MAG: hypothetical protein A2W68_14950 [Betaproteobacteria bacterium RIFCSPLOWO2_02_64_14]